MSALTPRPGIMKIAPYVPGKDSVDGKADDRQAVVQRRRARARAPRRWRPTPRRRPSCIAIPTAAPSTLRAAIGRHYGLDAERIVCGAGSDELLNLLVRAYCGPGDELLYSQFGFLMYPINALGVGATPVAAPEKDYRADVDALLAKVTDKTRVGVPGQSQQPDRQLHHQGRRAPPACRPAEERAAGDRRGLCRVRQPQRLRIGRRAGRPGRERRDDPHLLEDLRHGRPAARLDVRPGRRRRRDAAACASRSTSTCAAQVGGHRRARRHRPHRRQPHQQRHLAALAQRRARPSSA